MRLVRTIEEIRAALAPARSGTTVGLVPTMGALHHGHLSLVAAARNECNVVVASIFVNPTQFEDEQDLARYPRDERRDAETAAAAGIDVLFVPSRDEMYPSGFQTWVEVEDIGRGLEGAARPGHFRGVATICLKLFNIVGPDRVYFGQKDAQQAALIQRLVRDLDLPLTVRILPTVRDTDGLAFSSRNAQLSAAARSQAVTLPRALEVGRAAFAAGANPVVAASRAFDGIEPEYVELLDLDGATVLAAAARIGGVRLIDNVLLKGELP